MPNPRLDDSREAQKVWDALSDSDKNRVKHKGAQILLGEETREGWSGYLPWYLFWSTCCNKPSKDYAHGFPGDQYFLCSHCGG